MNRFIDLISIRHVQISLYMIIACNSLGQNKKEQIAILNSQLDSVQKLHVSDSVQHTNTINTLHREYSILTAQYEKSEKLIDSKSRTIREKNELIQFLNKEKIEIMKENNGLRRKKNSLNILIDSLKNENSKSFKLPNVWYSIPGYLPSEAYSQFFDSKNSKVVASITYLQANSLKVAFAIYESKEDRFVDYNNQISFGYKQFLKYVVGTFKNDKFILEKQWEQTVGPSMFDDHIEHVDVQITDLDDNGAYELWFVNNSYEGISDVSPTDLTIYTLMQDDLIKSEASTCDGIQAHEYFGKNTGISTGDSGFNEFIDDNLKNLKNPFDKNSVFFEYLKILVEKNSCGAP